LPPGLEPSGHLGDTLQWIAGQSPAHLALIETFADVVAEHLKRLPNT